MGKYDQKKKREYYLSNREERLAYQNRYYRESKGRFRRRREIGELLEPELLEENKRKVSNYNRAYYAKNKEHILAQRRHSRVSQITR